MPGDQLVGMVREQAAVSGTSARAVELVTEDQVPKAAGGAEIFIGRVISATLVGRPDRVLRVSERADSLFTDVIFFETYSTGGAYR